MLILTRGGGANSISIHPKPNPSMSAEGVRVTKLYPI